MSNNVSLGFRVPCPGCGEPAERIKHGPDFDPPSTKPYYHQWNICRSPHCKKTVFYDSTCTLITAPNEEFDEFCAEVTGVDRYKLSALWYGSKTFRQHWHYPDHTPAINPYATKSEASMLFSCLAHFGFTPEDAKILMAAWFLRHNNSPEDLPGWVVKVFDPKLDEVRRYKEKQEREHEALDQKRSDNLLDQFAKLLVVQEFRFDPATKKCSVAGVAR